MIIDNSGTGIASLGRDEDRFVAHVAPGERVVPPVISADTQARLSREMMAAGLDPDEYIVGPHMSINPITGQPEFGWFKKTFKSLKKVAKKVAPVAMFIPGVGQALGAVGGSLLGKVGLGNLASGIGGLVGSIPGLGGVGSAITGGAGGTLGQALSFGGGAIKSGIGGLLGGVKSGISGLLGGGVQPYSDAEIDQMLLTMDPYAVEQIVNERNSLINQSKPQFSGLFGPDSVADKLFNVDPNKGTGPLSFLGKGDGNGFGGNAGIMGLSALAAKIAYDSAKERMGGMAETPKVTMDQLGRYEMAKNLGTGGSREDFGLAPAPVALNFAYGGEARQYFNKGGLAMVEELDMRDGGESDGPGTGTSDDIPAMLSDGEFVMTAKATRGAGSFDVNKTKSGIELIKGGSASREKGVENMRELMNIFEAI